VPFRRSWALFVLVLLGGVPTEGCRAGGCVANVLGDVVGETGDARCDRRFVSGDKRPAPFCQEIIDTVALSEFQDDCRTKHGAATGEGRCPRERQIGGCKLHKVNDDGSEVWDWFYDVTDIEADAGDAGTDADADAEQPVPVFDDPPRTRDDVRDLCADRRRYEEGATYYDP
jgi:hypothetical protein